MRIIYQIQIISGSGAAALRFR